MNVRNIFLKKIPTKANLLKTVTPFTDEDVMGVHSFRRKIKKLTIDGLCHITHTFCLNTIVT